MNRKFTGTALLLSTVLFAGCSNPVEDALNDIVDELEAVTTTDDDEIDEVTTTDDSAQSSTLVPGGGAPQILGEFNGNYLSDCLPDGGPDFGVWFIEELSIQDDIAVQTNTEYDDAECTMPFAVTSLTFSIAFPGGIVNTVLGPADFINVTLESGTFNGETAPVADVTFFDIVLLDGNNLHFGLETDDLDGITTPESRPVEIDTEVLLTRI